MSKVKAIFIIFISIFLITGCQTSTGDNASPKNVLANDPDADFFVLENTVYMNVEEVDWVNELVFKEGAILGRINKSGVKKDFEDWNATILDVDLAVYEFVGRNDIVLIKIDNQFIPYLKWIEG